MAMALLVCSRFYSLLVFVDKLFFAMTVLNNPYTRKKLPCSRGLLDGLKMSID